MAKKPKACTLLSFLFADPSLSMVSASSDPLFPFTGYLIFVFNVYFSPANFFGDQLQFKPCDLLSL